MPEGLAAALVPLLGDTLAPIGADALIGASLGAGTSAITGGNIGKGALFGGLSGGALGFAGPLGDALTPALGSAAPLASDVLLGAAGGTLGGLATGGNLGTSALIGAGGGLATGITSGAATSALGGAPTAATIESPAGGAPTAGGAAPAAASPGAASALSSGNFTGLTPTDTGIENINITAPTGPSASSVFAPIAGAGGFAATAPLGGGGGTVSAPITPTGLETGSVPGLTGPSASPLGAASSALGTDSASIAPVSPYTPSAGAGSSKSLVPLYGGGTKFPASSSLTGDLTKSLTSPSTLLSLGALGYEAASQPKLPSPSATIGQIQNTANQLNTTGTSLMSYLTSGQLPPGAKTAIDQATRSAKAEVKSRMASLGLSGSSTEASALSEVDNAAAAQTFSIADQLLQQGISASGMSADLYSLILQASGQQNAQLTGAITNFASSLAGGGKSGVNINIPAAA